MHEQRRSYEIQGILSAGYVYLVVMGILSETLYFNQIGVDILEYSSILDVLISPISQLTSSLMNLVAFLVTVLLAFKLPKFLIKHKDKNWYKKSFKWDTDLSDKERETSLLRTSFSMLALGLFGFYIGTGIGGGFRLAQAIQEDTLVYSDRITFTNGDVAAVQIVGINSAYVFYMADGNDSVQITPIGGVVQAIEDNE